MGTTAVDVATCPCLYMDDYEWWECPGNAYQIYRVGGSGLFRVGDFVGIHYPPDRNHWLGCSGRYPYCNCRTYNVTCPGTPNWPYHGFIAEKWFKCWGLVFMIYARGKGLGDVIEEHDDVSLYYLQDGNWISQRGTTVQERGRVMCLGIYRPPASYKSTGNSCAIIRIAQVKAVLGPHSPCICHSLFS